MAHEKISKINLFCIAQIYNKNFLFCAQSYIYTHT